MIVVCGDKARKVEGTYEGTNIVTVANGSSGEYKVSIIVEQTESELSLRICNGGGPPGQRNGKAHRFCG